jgi:hypothetical protein
MKSYVAEALIIIGGLLILCPLYARERSNDRIAEFYSRNGSAIGLPEQMQVRFGPYDWDCLVLGLGAIGTGVGFAGRQNSPPSAR